MRLRIIVIEITIACLVSPIMRAAQIAQTATQAEALHVLNRLAFGPRPGDVERVMKMGWTTTSISNLTPKRSRCLPS
jgi:hypothetical protein